VDVMNKHLVFVYGTLRTGGGLHRLLEDSINLGNDSLDGVLLNLGPYPGFVDGEGVVVGECYKVTDAKLKQLDSIECGAGYRREKRRLHLRGELAYVYFYQTPNNAPTIASGDWHNR
jgi:gamma-glutamylcyclotransferase (GGCT)/AIG2-like uncharacterized protein YtfP